MSDISKMVLTRDVTTTECPWLDRDLKAGEVVFRYPRYTYGCVSILGIAVTVEADATPFFEVPKNAVEARP